MHPFLAVTAHKYIALSDLKDRRATLLPACRRWHLKGSILLSPEGISLSVAGDADAVQWLIDELHRWPGLEDLRPRVAGIERHSFGRMMVRVKREIAALGVDGVDPAQAPVPGISPQELRQWLDDGKPVTLLDVRNDYESAQGSFRNAVRSGIGHFHEFPQQFPTLELHYEPVIVFCTTGLRSEKAAAFLRQQGMTGVRSLDGGVLSYVEHCGDVHFEGECFLFEQRGGIDPGARQTQWTECPKCRHPLTLEDHHRDDLRADVSCPYCHEIGTDEMAARIALRHAQIDPLIHPLPGSVPQDLLRPLTITAACDGMTLIEALCRIVTHVPELFWQERCKQGLLLDAAGNAIAASAVVRAGERYFHRFPAVIEPDVNMRIELIHEDEALLVLNKPAPLPMHAGGRFQRNTVKYILDALYHPETPRPAHRLDANTTGALVVARTQYFAGKIQSQFARGEVEKTYLTHVHGHPAEDDFHCAAPISADAGHAGSRVIDAVAGLSARTEFRVLRRLDDGTALLEARPLTGRTNQIRVHLWHLGFPICGDPVYLRGDVLGDSQTLPVDAPPLCLHAWRVRFRHPLLRKMSEFTAPPPLWFRAIDTESHDGPGGAPSR
ncbi:pseudouridine synthase [Povalibacter sp.]|uniref:oxygen-dependent tRNA uridine(34) hydroxylase TrhO n=1 Tax=Povalibacter sp. TaxID=1962978 RepID=UPI002F42AD66